MVNDPHEMRVGGHVRELATIGGGCFWCLDAVYRELPGIARVVSGYSGGDLAIPTYEQVCSGSTGHAEVVQITYDPEQITYESILDVFFSIHDPTTLNRQGNDIGTQYRSIILFHNEAQETAAKEKIREIERAGFGDDSIVTQVVPFQCFYPAESYHQDYFNKNPFAGYCRAVISPKVAKFRAKAKDT